MWKTRCVPEKHGGTIISPSNELSSLKWEVAILLFQIAMKINQVIPVFQSWKRINISWERKPFKCQRAVQWSSVARGVYFIFRSDFRRLSQTFFDLKKTCEILKTKATVAIFARLKAGYLKRVMTAKLTLEYKE